MNKVTPFLMFNDQLEAAIELYTSIFPDCEVGNVARSGEDGPIAPTQCGWIKDPFGLSLQIVPRRFTELIADSDPRKVKAAVDAMLKMVELDVAALERAHAEA